MYVCVCNAVTERTIHQMVASGCTTLSEVQAMTGCADCCGTCHDYALHVLDKALEQRTDIPATIPVVNLPQVA